MRFVLAALLSIVMLGAGNAYAGSAYEDVSRSHWAYNALDYLTARGVLEGYPDGFFKGDRTLTRYEFAQAIARLLDSMDSGNMGGDVSVIAQTLRAEFSDQLAELGRSVGMIGDSIHGLDARIGDLEGGVADNSANISDLERAVSGLTPGPDWQGSFRYRWQIEERDNAAGSQRFRQRIRFTLGYAKQINDAVEVAFRFKTNTGASAVDGNHTLGNNGRTANIYLDRAYVKYSPSWFGFYTRYEPGSCGGCGTCSDCNPRLDIYAGLFPNITHDPHEMILDDEVNMQGVGLVYHFSEDFQLVTLASVALEFNGGDYIEDSAFFYATELKYENFISNRLDAWIGAYGWKGENRLSGVFEDNAMYNFDFNNDGVIDGNDRFTPNFHTAKGGLQYTWESAFDQPLAVYAEYMVNLDSDAETRIAAVNPFVDPDIIYDSSDDFGWVVGAQLGEVPQYCTDWMLYASYKEIGSSAIIDGFGDADAGGANVNSFELGWDYMWADNSLFGITYFLNIMHNAYGFLIPDNKQDQSIIQFDWSFKF